MRRLGDTKLEVFPLCLGGNVFGWTADEKQSFAVLDAYAEAGGNFIDTADVYPAWAPGNRGGESEAIIGRWMKERKNRDRMVIATKVGQLAGFSGLGRKTIAAACQASRERLQVDTIDLYYAHKDDPATPLDETLGAFDMLVREGKVRYLGASNYSAQRLATALDMARSLGLARFSVLQPHYNLMQRREYEQDLRPLCEREHLACLPYFALARGFLTGKYRPGKKVESARAGGVESYLDERGVRVLEVLDGIAARHKTTVAAVTLAWLLAQRTVAAPIASARTPEQLNDLLPMASLELAVDELARLDKASS